MEVTCSMSGGSYGYWVFYRTRIGFKDVQNMAKINAMKQECRFSALQTTKSTYCSCAGDTLVMCNMSDESISKAGDQWHCSRFINGSENSSEHVTVPNQGKPGRDMLFEYLTFL
ncbi:hypothetical protein DPMN_064434 [Dreissena polymorpha]|uniref:Uncharacterized protein n=1 Tax=Dreissena polymorpha TaxID=45954 RepID=A0A9D4HM52_DREPO|nr:hypothetical protein DPMN_064434 [Dreissena polymorpha]